MVIYKRFADPLVYEKGRKITVAGVVEGGRVIMLMQDAHVTRIARAGELSLEDRELLPRLRAGSGISIPASVWVQVDGEKRHQGHFYNGSPFFVVVDTSKPNQLNYPVNITILSPSTYRLTIDDKYNISKVLYFGQKFNHESFNFMLLPRHPESLKNLTGYPLKYYFVMNDINSLVNQYRSGLNVEVNDEKGSILTLSLLGPNKDQICDYLNKLSEVYIQSNLDEKANIPDLYDDTSELRAKTDEMRDQLRLQDHPLGDFLTVAANNMVALPKMLANAREAERKKVLAEMGETARKKDVAGGGPAGNAKPNKGGGAGDETAWKATGKSIGLTGTALDLYVQMRRKAIKDQRQVQEA